MAVRQYIGARYVPKFSDQNGGVWSSTYSYEALEIVKHGNDYYTAKKPVPTGIAITNTDYWVLTGNYNGAISDLYDKIGTLANLDTIDKSDLVSAINEDHARIDNIENSLNGKILMIGDSIATIQNSENKTFYELFAQFTGKTVNTDAFISAVSSRGFTTTFATNGNFEIIFENFWDDHPTLDPSDFSAIIVTGGANDINSSVTNIEVAIVSFINAVKTKCPNAKIYIGVNTRNQVNQTGSQGFKNVYLPGYKTCRKHGAIFINGLEYVLFNSLYQTDKLHPTAAGVDLLAYGLYEGILTGQAHVNTEIVNSDSNFIYDSSVSSISNLICLSELQQDDIIQIAPIGLDQVEITAVTTFSGGSITLGHMTNNIWYSSNLRGIPVMYVPLRVTKIDDTTEYYPTAILYKFIDTYYLIAPGFTFNNVKKATIMRPVVATGIASLAC